MVIKLSAAELSRDILQYFVHLIHQKSHVHEDSKRKNSVQTPAAAETDNTSHDLAREVGSQSCGDLFITVPAEVAPPANIRNLKGKPNLMLAISSFGYQILRCPHFAELCWVTSKLKVGPSAEIGGPWKGWPFNSCIIRATNSPDKATVACGSSNTKSKEKFGLVRGLVAVGLTAYKGLYASLREVSSEVRKVLELLVGWINAKVNSGKDRYQYVHILSQVAYLEDMVNNWVYSLQSLDQDLQIKAASPNAFGSQGSYSTCVNDMDRSRSCPESKGPGVNTKESAVQNTDFIDLSKKDDNEEKVELLEEAVQGQGIGISGNTISEEHLNSSPANQPTACVDEQNATNSLHASESTRSRMVERELTAQNKDSIDLNKMVDECVPSHKVEVAAVEEDVVSASLCDNTISLEHRNRSLANDQLCVDEHNRTMPRPSGSVNTGNPMLVGDPRSSKQCNGFAPSKNVLSENGFCSSDELDSVTFSGSGKTCSRINASEIETTITPELGKPDDHEQGKYPDFVSNGTALPAEPETTCFYRCCSGCLHTLLGLMQKLLCKEWKLGDDYWTVDDIYDTVALLSMDLLSTVRKVYGTGCSSNKFDENLRNENHGNLSNCPEWSRCCCKSSEDGLVIPTQCSCHSVGTTSPNIQADLDPEFVYRDGVMVPIDSSKEVSFHCKFDTLCLCSLIVSLSMTKQPSE
ncbi:2-oxoglutarate and Fe(II)-dependent oxygenase superfamily protein isoform 1 [Hibiscus syriacus]|uniref:2-oxoglutarate and Fe(II)-dependent oxygenase superfamily protein isoform 1 n=2 Tax=Hibiscus syriacus TaxID=106335 RepID=A0A6A3AE35_HIBSY|nr:2-oxoglutarate and Fe(II)-dependent oxygenase superfamily protein isoform 1 [Hibiscus syriacus]